MAVNKSSNKVRVNRLFGGSDARGMMDPHVDMLVKNGIDSRWITTLDSGNYQVGLALASGGTTIAKAYPHNLVIDEPVASGYGWPTSTDCILFGHSGAFPSGVPEALGTGMFYESGAGNEVGFSRPK